MLAISALATGNEGVNPPQSGVITVSNGLNIVTNTFAFPFQQTPLVVMFSSLAAGAPITNNFVTTTNFAFTFPLAGTNASFSWQAFVGGTRMQSGTNALVGGTPLTNTFAFAYAIPPVVVPSQGATNSSAIVAVTSVSTTGFIELSSTTQTGSWIAIGTVQNPPSENTGQNPPSNKVIF